MAERSKKFVRWVGGILEQNYGKVALLAVALAIAVAVLGVRLDQGFAPLNSRLVTTRTTLQSVRSQLKTEAGNSTTLRAQLQAARDHITQLQSTNTDLQQHNSKLEQENSTLRAQSFFDSLPKPYLWQYFPDNMASITAICSDWWLSHSQSASGTCSSHGGVTVWVHHP